MSIFENNSCNVSIHGDAAGPIGVPGVIIPSEVDSCKFCAFPVCVDLIVLLESLEEMECMFFSNVFDAKVVDEFKKLDGEPLMAREARGCGRFVISCILNTGEQGVISELA